MKKFWIQFAFLVAVILGSLYLSFRTDLSQLPLPISKQAEVKRIKVASTIINAEIADTPKLRTQGLAGREKLASDSGVLFIFSESKKYQFWMKNMKLAIDMIFISDGNVVDILKNVPPPTLGTKDEALPIYQPVLPVNMVLEVGSGFVDANGIKLGDNVFEIK